MSQFDISAPNEAIRPLLQEKIDNLSKPKGALGRLEELAMQIGLIQQTLSPTIEHPCHLLFGGDHGIEREGVSVSPREVTWQQMVNFTRGGGGVNMFCRQHGFRLRIIDVGVDHDLSQVEGIIDRKMALGTRNFRHEPAMSTDEYHRALNVGAEMVDACVAEGCHLLSIGEMGVGNTSPSSVWMHLLCGIPLEQCIGAGAGLDSPGMRHKLEVLSESVGRYRDTSVPPIPYFGGFEMVAAVGTMLRAAERQLVILIDGFIMTACALAAVSLCPAAKHYMIFTHCGDESGHRLMLEAMNVRPLLHLGLRLGEGTGALCAFPIVDSAVRMINEMRNFKDAEITKYF
ncbi:MAG: nicotinate-nucleotide--dimethylbenzimidazole phosphoribosyltransferase [Prevotella sp.]|nr:nicotinate-nucleotide--dimethylbenzimidazole phosphoribosyltransferase [Prevotella sp.]